MDKILKIRFTSDTHGFLYPTSYADTQDRPMGLMKLAGEYPHDGNTLILDGGDTLQGSPMTNLYQRLSAEEKAACVSDDTYGSHPFAAMMNLAGYQFVTLGNHDFNYGLEALGDYLNNLDALCLCANIHDKACQLPIAPYAVHQLENGLRVGLVGACTHYVSRWENPKTVEELGIEEPVEAARRALEAVKPLCDLTILIYHGGYECDLQTGEPLTESRENEACRICNELDFDLVLTGHQHMAVEGLRIGNSYTVQPSYRAPHCCALTVTVHDDGTKDFESTLLPASGAPIAGAEALLAPLERRVQEWLDTPTGPLNIPLNAGDHLRMAVEGCPLVNFINTVQLAASGAQIATTALANEIKGLPTTVTVRDVVSTYIYSNTLVVLEMTGADLRRYMERTACYFGHDEDGKLCLSDEFMRPKVQHYKYDYFSGVDYIIDTRKPIGERIVSVKLNGRELGMDEKVSVCINSYRFCGTSGYDMLPGQKVLREVQTDVADAIIDYITKNPEIEVDTHKYCEIIG